ncbi:MAG: hypothetical protein B7Z66_12400 [Chromatiales bacterium 21-64-14]|nr:MAG: hypothetical protein B7Z66_12400 [Chromatiales bacterium 21-64-14]HQU16967.1 hypothetical protein [Gammaproteobacteria bacterium]
MTFSIRHWLQRFRDPIGRQRPGEDPARLGEAIHDDLLLAYRAQELERLRDGLRIAYGDPPRVRPAAR